MFFSEIFIAQEGKTVELDLENYEGQSGETTKDLRIKKAPPQLE